MKRIVKGGIKWAAGALIVMAGGVLLCIGAAALLLIIAADAIGEWADQ